MTNPSRKTIQEGIEALRSIPAKWKRHPDPIDALRRIREGEAVDVDREIREHEEKNEPITKDSRSGGRLLARASNSGNVK